MLLRKMLRDIRINKGSYMACIVIIILGVLIFNVFSIGYDNFRISQEAYYKEYRFSDGFVELYGMSETDLDSLSSVPGISSVEGRMVKDVKLFTESEGKNIYLRLIGYYPDQEHEMNGMRLLQGVRPTDGNHMVLGNRFFENNSLSLGDSLNIISSGKVSSIEIDGVGQSPEYIYAMRTEQDIYPDPTTFGIAFVPMETLERLTGTSGQINRIYFNIEPGAEFDVIEDELKARLAPYGLQSIYKQKDQRSNLVLNQELTGMHTMAKVMPMLFLSIAAMIMFIMLKRMIETQRQQIGVMKAFGYKDYQILIHYSSYALFIGVIGGVLGGILGNIMVIPFTNMYQTMFNMPLLNASFSVSYFIKGIVGVIAVALIAGVQGAKATLKLEPSEAMKASTPKTINGDLGSRLNFILKRMNLIVRLAVRSILRNLKRSFFIMVGMMFTLALLGMAWSMKDMLNDMILDQFEKVQTSDMKITLSEPVEMNSAIREIEAFDGITKVEGIIEAPIKLKNLGLSKDVSLYGLSENSEEYHLFDESGNEIHCTGSGLILSERLSDLLDVKVGDYLYIESGFMKDATQSKRVQVDGIIPQYLGLNAFMKDTEVMNVLDQSSFVTSLLVSGNQNALEKIRRVYGPSDVVFGMDLKSDIKDKYKEMMEMFTSMMGMLCIFGIITGFAVIYASSIITISERKRELASMLVIGMSYKEVLSVILTEQWIISAAAIIFGIPLMKLMNIGMAAEMNNDVYTMSTNVSLTTILISILLAGVSILIAQRAIKRKIDDINLVEALSMKE